MIKRIITTLAIAAMLALQLALPAIASHNPDHYSLPWSKTCAGTQTVVSRGDGYFWQNHLRYSSSQYFSYSGRQVRNAYWWGYSSGSGVVDSLKTDGVYGWCHNVS